MYEVRIFRDEKGREPVVVWLDELKDRRAVARISARIERLHSGLFGDSKMLRKGVHELRIDYGSGYRVYYGIHGARVILLLCGGDKTSQRKDISRAIRYWQSWKASQ